MILTSLEVDPKEFESRTGWVLRPEGACKGDSCVPLPDAAARGRLDARMLSQRLGMQLIRDADANVWCLGPEAMGRALTTAQAPELVLPDYQGNEFSLSSLRGQKVLFVTWSSW
jgi:hypothetical protein